MRWFVGNHNDSLEIQKKKTTKKYNLRNTYKLDNNDDDGSGGVDD